MSRNAITYEEGTQIKSLPKNPSLPLPADDHDGEPVHGDPVENPDNVNEYEKEEEVDMPDDVGYEEELAVEEDVVESEDELADFIVDEDEIGHLRKRDYKKKKYMEDANEIFGGDVQRLRRVKISEESTGSPPVDERSIDEESSWK
ncbi:transcription elongation factor SPT6 homolog [Brassica rapa]|uniref:Spt6 acidic N-terminal domain-containing protein n=2 Tax=Brassica TaxID=3705 RepID=A0A3P6C3V6_BRACM|nr:transcription elongation factor SPT6 homolog [Brassica rapa]XP_033133872.1 transcription elongation factor SPT6 homolog [Brassica rapa]CAF2236068.1 unnamed protein product [Brassica napus]CAG7897987.1 unnamed protein product [Brassica rapa]CDY64556.1 BnaA08g30550D [Brassica napus]VDD04231.1 unnamed protein product [Brassica rapa]